MLKKTTDNHVILQIKSENENIAYERVLVKKAIKYHLTCQTRATWLTKTKGL